MKDRKLLNIELGRLTPGEYRQRKESGLVLVLDNIRSAHNVGSAFRTSDAFGVDKIYLGGICPVPPSPELRKVALGAEEVVPFQHVPDVVALVEQLKPNAKKADDITKTLSHILDGLPTDCGHCSLKSVCDEVEGMREMHMGKKKV